jgi:hypothetical protein
MNKPRPDIAQWMARVSAIVIALMPFHAFLTVWASSLFGHYTALRLWKEVLLLALVFGVVYLFATRRPLRQLVVCDKLFWCIGAYLLLLLVAGVVAAAAHTVTPKALAYGLLLDSRFLIFFVVTWVVTQYSDLLVRAWQRLVLVPAGLAVAFATLQWSLLPPDFLKHFGYGPDTTAPAATVDQKAGYERVQSTLRGANPFGAYLVIVLSLVGARLLRFRRSRMALAGLYLLSGEALYYTYSRSAWLGALLATACLVLLVLRSTAMRRLLLLGGVTAVIVFAAVGYLLRDNDHFQNVIFHTNEHSRSAESSEHRAFSIYAGWSARHCCRTAWRRSWIGWAGVIL